MIQLGTDRISTGQDGASESRGSDSFHWSKSAASHASVDDEAVADKLTRLAEIEQQAIELRSQLEVASRYGGGVDANENPIRPTKHSKRPSSYIPSAWDAFSEKQKREIEGNLEATRSRLRSELSALDARAAALKGNIALNFCKCKNNDSIV